jgi:hypothetical protein
VDGQIARDPNAVRFFRLACQMELSGEDWRHLLSVAEARQAPARRAPNTETEPSDER